MDLDPHPDGFPKTLDRDPLFVAGVQGSFPNNDCRRIRCLAPVPVDQSVGAGPGPGSTQFQRRLTGDKKVHLRHDPQVSLIQAAGPAVVDLAVPVRDQRQTPGCQAEALIRKARWHSVLRELGC